MEGRVLSRCARWPEGIVTLRGSTPPAPPGFPSFLRHVGGTGPGSAGGLWRLKGDLHTFRGDCPAAALHARFSP